MIRHLNFEMFAPDRLFYARRTPAGEHTAAHDHNFWEAFLVLDGHGQHILNGRQWTLERGDCWLVRPEDVHALGGDERYCTINVAWRVEGWERWLDIAALNVGEAQFFKRSPELEPSFVRMSDAFAAGSAREGLHLARFWAEVAPHFWPSTGEIDPRPAWMRRTLERFEREDGVRGGYRFLLEIAPVSPRQLHREWVRAFERTPGDWVIFKRLERAALLLLQTPMTVGEIAVRCGFENVPYFHRVWKQEHGVSPKAFREQARFRD